MSVLEEYESKVFRQMLAAGQLPQPENDDHARAIRKAGIKLKGSDMLRTAQLPPGWEAVQTGDQWGVLIDDQGRRRGRFHYKMWERAFLQMQARYTTWRGRPDNHNWCAFDHATGTVLFEPESTGDDSDAYDQCKDWLDQHFPRWREPWRYWDDKPQRRWWQFWR